jgi:hypothetical protein
MSKEAVLHSRTFPASADLSTKQYLFCLVNSSGKLAVNTSAGGRCHGVLQNNPSADGQAGQLAILGTTKVQCAGSFNPGDPVTSNNAGKAVIAATGNKVLGFAEEAGASGQIAAICLLPSGTL